MGQRRRAREYALQALYMYDIGTATRDDLVALFWIDEKPEDSIRDFATDLISGTIDRLDEIDAHIEANSRNWTIERIASVDRAILRISIYSLLYRDDVPAAVTIDEAIELGKLYGGDNSGQFINGILDALRRKERDRSGG